MFYETNRLIRLTSHFLFWGIIFLTFALLTGLIIFFLFNLITGIGKSGILGPSFFEIFLFIVTVFFVCAASLSLLLLIRLYQIVEKWDQLFTIKNARKFLDLGIDGERFLQFNLRNQEIKRLREKNELAQAKQSS